MKFEKFFGNQTFDAHVWELDEPESCKSFAFPGALEDRWVAGISIKVEPEDAECWLGHFSAGRVSPSAASFCCAHPDGHRLVVVSRGIGYVVSAINPLDWQELSILPILGYCVASTHKVLVLFGYTRLIGLLPGGTAWKTTSLSWDGLRNVHLVNDKIHGEGWDAPTSSFVEFEVDIETGEAAGGTSPR
jgi:hypothetical protein